MMIKSLLVSENISNDISIAISCHIVFEIVKNMTFNMRNGGHLCFSLYLKFLKGDNSTPIRISFGICK